MHQGFSCESTEAQGGHYYIGDTDPWPVERYSSNQDGYATYNGVVDIGGPATLLGRAFVLHNQAGGRVACGILEPVASDKTYYVETEPLTDNGVTSHAFVAADIDGLDDGEVCVFGYASGLEAGLQTFEEGGLDCTATNGCGVHVHEGFGCESSATQLGHFYNKALPVDPWLLVGYESTTEEGDAMFFDCVQTGLYPKDFEHRAFIVHANDGSRQSCGILYRGDDLECEADGKKSGKKEKGDKKKKKKAKKAMKKDKKGYYMKGKKDKKDKDDYYY